MNSFTDTITLHSTVGAQLRVLCLPSPYRTAMQYTFQAAYQPLHEEISVGRSTNVALKSSQLGSVTISFPRHAEQRAIPADLDAVSARLVMPPAGIETAIPRLTGYRQVQISAAVTDKVCLNIPLREVP